MAEQLKKVPSRLKEENANSFEKIMEWLSETLDNIHKKLKDDQIRREGTNTPGENKGNHDELAVMNIKLFSEDEQHELITLSENLLITKEKIQDLHDEGEKVTEKTKKLKEQLEKAELDQIELEKSFTKKDQEWQTKLREAEDSTKITMEQIQKLHDEAKKVTEETEKLKEQLKKAELDQKDLKESFAKKNVEMQSKLRNAEEGKKYAYQKAEELYKENEDYQTKLRSVEDSFTRKSEELKGKYELLKIAVRSIRSLKALVTGLQYELEEKGETCAKLTTELKETKDAANEMKKTSEEFQAFRDSAEAKNIEMKKEFQEFKDSAEVKNIEMKKEFQALKYSLKEMKQEIKKTEGRSERTKVRRKPKPSSIVGLAVTMAFFNPKEKSVKTAFLNTLFHVFIDVTHI